MKDQASVSFSGMAGLAMPRQTRRCNMQNPDRALHSRGLRIHVTDRDAASKVQAKLTLPWVRRVRYAPPIRPKPMIIIAQVAGSGTEASERLTPPKLSVIG